MSAYYDLFEKPDVRQTGEQQSLYARFVPKGTIDRKEFIERVHLFTGLSRSLLEGAMAGFMDELRDCLANGWTVELGELDRVKIENMLEQNRALRAKREAEKKEMGMLAICTGEGISEIFKDLLVDRVIEGGQTMNPSASDIATAVQKVNAEHVFVFPNNKNIILAAEQAKALVEKRTIHVIPTKNIPQGFAAALAFNSEASADCLLYTSPSPRD